MDTAEFAYDLPPELIAQEPCMPRDAARLLVVPGAGTPVHAHIRDLPQWLRPGDLLVMNHTRVIPARLFARKSTGGALEVLLLHPDEVYACTDGDVWRALIRGQVRVGMELRFHQVAAETEAAANVATDPAISAEDQASAAMAPSGDIAGTATATVLALHDDGTRTIRFAPGIAVLALCEAIGHVPLPPYIARPDRPADRERYQTVFADRPGSVAAPTAGLHLTTELLAHLEAMGIARARVDLRIGPGTFKPVDCDKIEDFAIHAERAEVPAETVAAVHAARQRGGRVIAVGTTAVRALESAARQPGGFAAWAGWTRLFLHPPQRMQVVDGLLTNFHLPRSSLLMLVSCLTGVERLRGLYAEAIRERYRFFSYGDAMLILPDGAGVDEAAACGG